jgi:hypothetical protein
MSKNTIIVLMYHHHKLLEVIQDPYWPPSVLTVKMSRRCVDQMGETANAFSDFIRKLPGK